MKHLVVALLLPLLVACGDMTACWRQARFLTLLDADDGSLGCAVVCVPEGAVITRTGDPEPLCGHADRCIELRSGDTALLWVPADDPDALWASVTRDDPRFTSQACK